MTKQSSAPTLSEYVESIWSALTTMYAASTLAQVRSILVRGVLPRLGGRPLAMITLREVWWMLREIERVRSRSSAARALWALRLVFRQAIRDGVLDRDPTTALRIRPVLRRQRKPLIPPGVLASMLACVDARTRALLALACYLGLRPHEILALRWDEIDPDRGFLAIPQRSPSGGGGRSRYLPLIGPVRDALAEYHRQVGGEGHEYVFGDVDTPPSPGCGSAWLRKSAPAWTAAGLPQITLMEGRQLAINYMAAAGLTAVEIAHLVGSSVEHISGAIVSHFCSSTGPAAAGGITVGAALEHFFGYPDPASKPDTPTARPAAGRRRRPSALSGGSPMTGPAGCPAERVIIDR